MSASAVISDFREQCLLRVRENTDKVTACLEHYNDDSIWDRSNEHTLALANQLLHLSGNITQYIISGLGGRPDARERDLEFSVRSGRTKAELLKRFMSVVHEAMTVIEECSEPEWMRHREVQGFHLSGIGIALHVVEHYSYHTGQIVAKTKERINRPMGFYDGIDLNTRNSAT